MRADEPRSFVYSFLTSSSKHRKRVRCVTLRCETFTLSVSVRTAGEILLITTAVKPTDDWIIRSTSPFRSEVSGFKIVDKRNGSDVIIEQPLNNHQIILRYDTNISSFLNFINL